MEQAKTNSATFTSNPAGVTVCLITSPGFPLIDMAADDAVVVANRDRKTYPLDLQRIKGNVKYFDERVQKGLVFPKPHPLETDVDLLDAMLLLDGWYYKTND